MPWPGRRGAVAETQQIGRRARRRPSVVRRWLPTAFFGLLIGVMVFLFATLRILTQAPDPAQSAPIQEVEAVAPVIDVAAPIAPDSAPAPGESVTSRDGIRFAVRQVDPSYTVISGDSLSAIAQRFGTTAEALQGINNLPDSFLKVGQRLVIP